MNRSAALFLLTGCAPLSTVAPTAREALDGPTDRSPAATVDDPVRVPVHDYETDSGHTVVVWVQGNSDMVAGAEVCFEDECVETDEDGLASVRGLPDGEVALTVDGGRGVSLLLPYTLTNDRYPHLAARSLTAGIYDSWTDGAWTRGTGLVDLWPIDATRSGSPVVPGLELTSDAGDIWSVEDLAGAVPSNTSSGTGPLWITGLEPGEVTLTMTLPGGLCSARSVGWPVPEDERIDAGDTVQMTVPVEADRSTSLYVHCVPPG
jgi:hypothetical protein